MVRFLLSLLLNTHECNKRCLDAMQLAQVRAGRSMVGQISCCSIPTNGCNAACYSSQGRQVDGGVDLQTGRIIRVFIHDINTVQLERIRTALCLVETVVAHQKVTLFQINTSRQRNKVGITWSTVRQMLETIWFLPAYKIRVKATVVHSHAGGRRCFSVT
jgi:hypothetical protein